MQKPDTSYNCLVVLGTTASGKTRLACQLAYQLNGEIISADSRQVYTHLNIGTGKDLYEYIVEGKSISYHLIDCCEPSEQFYLHQFVEGLAQAFNAIQLKQKLPIVCGGTGLYLDALRKDFLLTAIPENEVLRSELKNLTKDELVQRINEFPVALSTHVDRDSVKRLIRGIEVAEFRLNHAEKISAQQMPKKNANYKPLYIGIQTSLEERKRRITLRLKQRLENGLIEEVEGLVRLGVTHERLQNLGLEYKFVSNYLQGHLTKNELFLQLQTAIFQFAKRQATWFRKMEKEGVEIHWVSTREEAFLKVTSSLKP